MAETEYEVVIASLVPDGTEAGRYDKYDFQHIKCDSLNGAQMVMDAFKAYNLHQKARFAREVDLPDRILVTHRTSKLDFMDVSDLDRQRVAS